PNDEVDQLEWLPLAAARERLSYDRDIALLDELLGRPVGTMPLILLRHAEAGSKPETGGHLSGAADLARPLAARGAAHAGSHAGGRAGELWRAHIGLRAPREPACDHRGGGRRARRQPAAG